MENIGTPMLPHGFRNVELIRRILLPPERENPTDTDERLRSLLQSVVWDPNVYDIRVINLLVSSGASVNARDCDGKTALHIASNATCHIVAEILLNHGAAIDSQDNTGMTPLHDACKAGSSDKVEVLLRRGANVNIQDCSGDTPAHVAASYGYPSVLRQLISYGVNVNLQNCEGLTPLHMTPYSESRQLEVVDVLLESDADVDLSSNLGDTALHRAIFRSFNHRPNKIYERLLQKGAQLDARNNNGRTPFDYCLNYISEEEENIKTTLEKHIVKLKTAGIAVDIDLDTELDVFKDTKKQCLEELERMRLVKINDLFSLDTVFFISKNLWFLKNADILLTLEEKIYSVNLNNDFPLYGQILTNAYEKTKRRFDLLEQAFSSLNGERRKSMSKKLPDLVKFKILNYLNNYDLKSLIESE